MLFQNVCRSPNWQPCLIRHYGSAIICGRKTFQSASCFRNIVPGGWTWVKGLLVGFRFRQVILNVYLIDLVNYYFKYVFIRNTFRYFS